LRWLESSVSRFFTAMWPHRRLLVTLLYPADDTETSLFPAQSAGKCEFVSIFIRPSSLSLCIPFLLYSFSPPFILSLLSCFFHSLPLFPSSFSSFRTFSFVLSFLPTFLLPFFLPFLPFPFFLPLIFFIFS